MLEEVRAVLMGELEAAGFRPDPLVVKLVAARMRGRGVAELAALFRQLRPRRNERAMCAYHLGTGASLTEFLVAGLGLDRPQTAAVATLGAIAHLIFACFDRLLDTADVPPEMLRGFDPTAPGHVTRAADPLLPRLVSLYWQRLDALAPREQTHRQLLERAIRRLYEAELASAPGAGLLQHSPWRRRKVWWRKNALPLLVMGLPGWLLRAGGRNIECKGHLLWLGRVGEFFGWLDDFCDFESDSLSGQLNRLALEPARKPLAMARMTGAKGRFVLRLWDARNPDSPLRDTFRVLSWTWLTNLEL